MEGGLRVAYISALPYIEYRLTFQSIENAELGTERAQQKSPSTRNYILG